ncbi:MAG TPA: LPS export ABC transporter periplasmic protein LptC [Prolixibacteraceae bacterium]|nr:LPS export ABC transporter periplasmic protein LptC [Prolixibacteraceae bacterium]
MNQQQSGTKTTNWLKTLSIAALVTGAAILFTGCQKNNIEEIKAFYTTESLPIQEATNFETLFTDSGQVRFSLKAPKLLRFEADGRDYTEFPEGLELVKYDEHQKVISSITANYARQYLADHKWEAKNNVIATNANGDTLKTEVLYWEEKNERIYTDEFVKIIRTDQIITGIGFTSDQKMQNWKIRDPKGTIYVSVNNQQQSADTTQNINRNVKTDAEPLKGVLQMNKPAQ